MCFSITVKTWSRYDDDVYPQCCPASLAALKLLLFAENVQFSPSPPPPPPPPPLSAFNSSNFVDRGSSAARYPISWSSGQRVHINLPFAISNRVIIHGSLVSEEQTDSRLSTGWLWKKCENSHFVDTPHPWVGFLMNNRLKRKSKTEFGCKQVRIQKKKKT